MPSVAGNEERSKRWKRVLLGAGALILLVIGLTAYVAIPVASHLKAARDALSGGELGRKELERARRQVLAAQDRLDSLPAKVLRVVPLVGGNLGAVEDVTAALEPVVAAARELESRARVFRRGGFVQDGRIRIPELQELADPLRGEVVAMRRLETAAASNMNGTLAPPLWDALSELRDRAGDLYERLDAASVLLQRAPALLGTGTPRRYLLMLVNNAELRGAGGVLAGVGSIRFDNGKMTLERLYSVHDLQTDPPIEVPAPRTYERRFGRFQANTTLWLNTTYSPDVPDVALVASRLFEKGTGVKTSGALLLDPRGLAALLDPDAELTLPGVGEIAARDLPRAIYSDVYEAFDDQVARRDAILQLGAQAFETLIDNGLPDDGVQAIGDAVGGGHLTFVSFDKAEADALQRVGAAHDLPPVVNDTLLVTVQNFGGGGGQGTKLDYWVDRKTEHSCEIPESGPALCATSVSLTNNAPKGLTRYVAGNPYGLLRSYVEVYIPGNANIEEVRVNGRASQFRPDPHDDRLSVGVYVEIPRGQDKEISVVYRLPGTEDGYQLRAIPQPLARDSDLRISVSVPDGWTTTGPGTLTDGVARFRGPFDSEIEIDAAPGGRKGLSALWDALKSFWNDPLF